MENILQKHTSYILQFIDSARFMDCSLSNLVNNVSEGIHIIKCKFGCYDKNYEIRGIKYKYWNCFMQYISFKDDLKEYKCLCCHKSYQPKFGKMLKEPYFNTYKFSNRGSKKFILLLGKRVYPYEYMSDWQKFNKT